MRCREASEQRRAPAPLRGAARDQPCFLEPRAGPGFSSQISDVCVEHAAWCEGIIAAVSIAVASVTWYKRLVHQTYV